MFHRTPGVLPTSVVVLLAFLAVVSRSSTAAQEQTPFARAWQAGTPATISGELTLQVSDDFINRRSELIHILQDHQTGTSHRLRFEAGPPRNLRSGARITVRGRMRGSEVEVLELQESAPTGATSSALQPSGTVFGEQKTVVLLINFTDNTSEPYTISHARDVMMRQVDGFVREASTDRAWISGDVFGWFTIPMSATTCDGNLLGRLAREAATAAGVTLTNYNRYVYAYPRNACGNDGAGTLGGNPSEAWINGTFGLRVVGHELGHNFGLYHAHFLDCEGLGPTDLPCTSVEYGNMVDIMGSIGTGHYNAFMKERLGWVGYPDSPGVITATSNGTYLLEPLSAPYAGGAKALRIPKSVDPITGVQTWYYVEFRQAVGYDSFLNALGTNVTAGVMVQTASTSDGNSSNLLDMNPATHSWYDHALTVGSSFTDESAGVVLTTTSVSAAGASLLVTLTAPACTRMNPSVTVSPGQSPYMAAGTPFSYLVTVANNESSGCPPEVVDLSATVPVGWTSEFQNTRLTIPPGSTGLTPFQLTSPPTAQKGTYALTIAASGSEGLAASMGATYNILSELVVQAASNRSSYTRNQKVDISAKVLAGVASAPGATVTFRIVRPDGSAVTSVTSTDASGTATYVLRLRAKDPIGTYHVTASAVANELKGVGTTSFSVR